MRFWDSSAIIPLCVKEPITPVVRDIFDLDSVMVVWWVTRTECFSALSRQRRENRLDYGGEDEARLILIELAGAWVEVLPAEAVRLKAERLLAVHPLRTPDAFQLAAALVWCQDKTAGMEFVSFDQRLRESARKEGLHILPKNPVNI
ncbi:MAG: type II toxin-antitoxin system VapC family toxin [Proteobacteria bacterium]|nr:type II toxin-antitoxin system VapC family toxin [Pseudomonadota bacterium]